MTYKKMLFFSQMQPLVQIAFYQKCINDSALMNKGAARALDKKCLKHISPEPMVQIQNNLTE